jgi:phosphoribosylformylglycinamidine cyclo-ligase
LGEVLLTPTRIYVKSLLAVQRATGAIKGLAHITGGGLLENIPRVLPDDLAVTLDLSATTVPPEMAWAATTAELSAHDMLATFNCGIGMVVIVSTEDASTVSAKLSEMGESVLTLGAVTTRTGNPVIIEKSLRQ